MDSGIWLETLRKITKSLLTQNSWSLDCNFKSEPPEYESAWLPTTQPCYLELLTLNIPTYDTCPRSTSVD